MAKDPQPANTRYQLIEQIPSVFLEKATVALIEAFLLARGYQMDPPRARGDVLFLSMVTASGARRLASIKEYRPQSFSDGIESLFVGYGEFEEGLSISVKFSIKAAESRLTVNSRHVGDSKVAEGLAGGVLAILEDVRTANGLYHPDPVLRGALTALFIAGIGVQLMFLFVYRQFFEFLFPFILLLYTYLYLAPMFNPYTTFDTPRNRKSRLWSMWLVGAALTLLLLWFASSLVGSLSP